MKLLFFLLLTCTFPLSGYPQGFLDDIETSNIKNIEKQIYNKIKSSSPEIIDNINNTGKLDEETEKKLISKI